MRGLICLGLMLCIGGGSSRAAAPEPVERRSAIVRAVERVSPAVVSVRVTMVVNRQASPFGWFFRDFRGPQRKREEAQAQGSGVVIDDRGYVLTNYHVVQGADRILLDGVDGKSYEADVVGTAPDHDLAVLRCRTKTALSHVPIGTSRDLMIGESVIAIGNPFGLSHTVTTGVVSALHRTIHTEERDYIDFIQTDASINPGNSGGPLLNVNGELIGVNTAIYGHAQGIGFAIPIDKAKRIVDDLIAHGEVRRPFFGFDTQALTPELAASFGVGKGGAVVSQVAKDGPATGKLRDGDVIVSIDGTRVIDDDGLRAMLGDYTVGSNVGLKVMRDTKPLDVVLQAQELSPAQAMQRLRERTGLELEQAGAQGSSVIAVKRVQSGSPAARIGLQRGDVVRAVDSQRVGNLDAFGKALARSYWRGEVTLMISRGRAWQQLAFKL